MDAQAVKDGKFILECTWQTLLCDGRSVILSSRLIHLEYYCLGKSCRALAKQTKYLAQGDHPSLPRLETTDGLDLSIVEHPLTRPRLYVASYWRGPLSHRL
jgi:hypothetical protein